MYNRQADDVNLDVLSDLTKRMTEGERVKPETEEEKIVLQTDQ